MLSKIKSLALYGLEGYLIDVQVDISSGMPCWEIVGLPDISVREAKERVRIAIKNSGFEFQSRKIIVNLAPADLRKEGTHFDLPIAIGLLLNSGQIYNIEEDVAFIGELSLDGKINKVNGILPMCVEAKRLGIKKIIVPKENAKEQGKIVYCIPNNLDAKNGAGINELIKDNAKIVVSPNQIIGDLNKEIKELNTTENLKIPQKYNKIYQILKTATTREEIAIKLNKNIEEINSLLTIMEIEGYIKQIAGNSFVRNN